MCVQKCRDNPSINTRDRIKLVEGSTDQLIELNYFTSMSEIHFSEPHLPHIFQLGGMCDKFLLIPKSSKLKSP